MVRIIQKKIAKKNKESTMELYELNKGRFRKLEHKKLVPIGKPQILSLRGSCSPTSTNSYGIHDASLEEILKVCVISRTQSEERGYGYVTVTKNGVKYGIPKLEESVEFLGMGERKSCLGLPVIAFQAYKRSR